jgi:hypothetical protein
MSEIFISYAKEDRGRAKELATRLEREGWSVFWDRIIPVGSTWDEILEHELSDMKVMVVIWSHASVASEWVRIEAEEAANRKILAPVLLEEVTLPIRFRGIHAADISDWIPSQDDTTGIRQLVDAIVRIGNLEPSGKIKTEEEVKFEAKNKEAGDPEESKNEIKPIAENDHNELPDVKDDQENEYIRKRNKRIIIVSIATVLMLLFLLIIWHPWKSNNRVYDPQKKSTDYTADSTQAAPAYDNTDTFYTPLKDKMK